MQNCLGELNLTYYLIYLDDVMTFSKTKNKHLKHLHIVFDHFWEHNLRLKPTKCEFSQDEINYLVHHVSKEGVLPSTENLKVVAEFTLPQMHTKIQAFLGLVEHYRWFIKRVASVAQPLHENPSGEGAHKKSKEVMFMAEAKDAFEIQNGACLKAPVLVFADFDKPFLLETNTSKLGLGAVLSQKQADSWYHPVAYTSQSPTTHE